MKKVLLPIAETVSILFCAAIITFGMRSIERAFPAHSLFIYMVGIALACITYVSFRCLYRKKPSLTTRYLVMITYKTEAGVVRGGDVIIDTPGVSEFKVEAVRAVAAKQYNVPQENIHIKTVSNLGSF